MKYTPQQEAQIIADGDKIADEVKQRVVALCKQLGINEASVSDKFNAMGQFFYPTRTSMVAAAAYLGAYCAYTGLDLKDLLQLADHINSEVLKLASTPLLQKEYAERNQQYHEGLSLDEALKSAEGAGVVVVSDGGKVH